MKEHEADHEHLAEAERLALLPIADQKEILALHQSVADNPKLPKRDRDSARERVEKLGRHLERLRQKPELLTFLPVVEQRDILALHQSVMNNLNLPKRERDFARARVEVLKRHLRQLRRKKD